MPFDQVGNVYRNDSYKDIYDFSTGILNDENVNTVEMKNCIFKWYVGLGNAMYFEIIPL